MTFGFSAFKPNEENWMASWGYLKKNVKFLFLWKELRVYDASINIVFKKA